MKNHRHGTTFLCSIRALNSLKTPVHVFLCPSISRVMVFHGMTVAWTNNLWGLKIAIDFRFEAQLLLLIFDYRFAIIFENLMGFKHGVSNINSFVQEFYINFFLFLLFMKFIQKFWHGDMYYAWGVPPEQLEIQEILQKSNLIFFILFFGAEVRNIPKRFLGVIDISEK